MSAFLDQLHRHALRVTTARQQVYEILNDATEPLSLVEIANQTKDIDRSSVYRTIELFARLGIVKVIVMGWKKRFELSDAFGPHHHHMRCTHCQSVHHIADSEIEQAIESVAGRYGFNVTSHQFELEGVCAQCHETQA